MLVFISLNVPCASTDALAAPGQWQAGARLGMAWLEGAGLGPSLDGYVRTGLSESIDLDVFILGSLHPFQPESKMLQIRQSSDAAAWQLAVAPGVTYRWDVLRAVPYVGAGVGVYTGGGSALSHGVPDFGASLRVGLDYLASRSVVASVQASAHAVLDEGSLSLPWFQVGVGLGHAWGW